MRYPLGSEAFFVKISNIMIFKIPQKISGLRGGNSPNQGFSKKMCAIAISHIVLKQIKILSKSDKNSARTDKMEIYIFFSDRLFCERGEDMIKPLKF